MTESIGSFPVWGHQVYNRRSFTVLLGAYDPVNCRAWLLSPTVETEDLVVAMTHEFVSHPEITHAELLIHEFLRQAHTQYPGVYDHFFKIFSPLVEGAALANLYLNKPQTYNKVIGRVREWENQDVVRIASTLISIYEEQEKIFDNLEGCNLSPYLKFWFKRMAEIYNNRKHIWAIRRTEGTVSPAIEVTLVTWCDFMLATLGTLSYPPDSFVPLLSNFEAACRLVTTSQKDFGAFRILANNLIFLGMLEMGYRVLKDDQPMLGARVLFCKMLGCEKQIVIYLLRKHNSIVGELGNAFDFFLGWSAESTIEAYRDMLPEDSYALLVANYIRALTQFKFASELKADSPERSTDEVARLAIKTIAEVLSHTVEMYRNWRKGVAVNAIFTNFFEFVAGQDISKLPTPRLWTRSFDSARVFLNEFERVEFTQRLDNALTELLDPKPDVEWALRGAQHTIEQIQRLPSPIKQKFITTYTRDSKAFLKELRSCGSRIKMDSYHL